MPIENTNSIFTVNSATSQSCPEQGCTHFLSSDNGVDESTNHLISTHGYKLLHVGTESDSEYSSTVAVLGKA